MTKYFCKLSFEPFAPLIASEAKQSCLSAQGKLCEAISRCRVFTNHLFKNWVITLSSHWANDSALS